MVLAVPVDHPVLAVGADLQFEGGDVVGLLRLLGNGALGGYARQNLQELEVDLENKQNKLLTRTESRVSIAVGD